MYTISFYSYKGGVGRSMALANVAALLSKRGRRVLVVDFDLEAPGLPSYEPFLGIECKKGIVDYVHEYLRTNQAPDAHNFIVTADIQGTPIWIMPAGSHTSIGYSKDLSTIDWATLYKDRSGFLLMEDLKQQWRSFEGQGFDYVLIDSRTGHTDVGGICTRQLPDAVVVMFVPTRQNVEGLVPIVRAIKSERAPVRKRPVTLYFCPSNVPELDDEDGILHKLLNEAARRLEYDETPLMINHYAHLELLEQKIFAISHEHSRLGKQYSRLSNELISGNLEDREGALIALKGLPKRFEEARRRNNMSALERDILGKMEVIRANFPRDGEIAFALARLADKMVRPDDEISCLSVAIEQGYEMKWALLRRAYVNNSLRRYEAAIEDARELFKLSETTLFEASPALDLLRGSSDPVQAEAMMKDIARNRDLDINVRSRALQLLITSHSNALEVVDLVQEICAVGGRAETTFTLALIASGQFVRTLESMGSRSAVTERANVGELFNFAMAEWGATGQAPRDLLEQVLELAADRLDANYRQCLALSHAVLGNNQKALDEIEVARRLVGPVISSFSCWSYRERYSDIFEEELDALKTQLERGEPIVPAFISSVA